MRKARVDLLGRVLNHPELLSASSGEAVARFDVGTTAYGRPSLEEPLTRHRCLAWNRGERNLADLVLENLRRGLSPTWRESHIHSLPSPSGAVGIHGGPRSAMCSFSRTGGGRPAIGSKRAGPAPWGLGEETTA
jgi:hypothetical protein